MNDFELDAFLNHLQNVKAFQEEVRAPIRDARIEHPKAALESLREAIAHAPSSYRDYLEEALACYENRLLRAAALMVWSAVMQHLYDMIGATRRGMKRLEEANVARFGNDARYRSLRRVDNLLYYKESEVIQLAEDAGMFNRTARLLLIERLNLRNKCGHPTRYQPGREEVVVFIESLLLNIVSGRMLNWPDNG